MCYVEIGDYQKSIFYYTQFKENEIGALKASTVNLTNYSKSELEKTKSDRKVV